MTPVQQRKSNVTSIRIEAAENADLIHLERSLPQGGPAKHAERIAHQERGEVACLIAWQKERPVGHALLKWSGSGDGAVTERLLWTCPDIEDLLVSEALRRRGIGTQLLLKAEARVQRRGIEHIGLSVGTGPDEPARRLYERLGYRDTGFGPYLEQGTYVDAEGQTQQWQQMCVYLIKHLS